MSSKLMIILKTKFFIFNVIRMCEDLMTTKCRTKTTPICMEITEEECETEQVSICKSVMMNK